MARIPWWGWLVIAAVCTPAGLLSYLWWAAERAPLDTDLWEGGDPANRWLTADERTDGSCNGRRS